MQKNATVEEMNEVITRFMGYEKVRVGYSGTKDATKWQKKNEGWMEKVGIDSVGDYYVDVENDEWMFCDDANYDKSWDALMPVGEKIYNLLAEMAKQRPPHTACHGDMIEVDIHCYIREYNIKKAHDAIYQFITWYQNQQKQNDGNENI